MSAWDTRDTDDSRRPEALSRCGRSQHECGAPAWGAPWAPPCQKECKSGVLSAVAPGPTLGKGPRGAAGTLTQEVSEGKTWGKGTVDKGRVSSRGQVTGNSEGRLLQPEGVGTFYCLGFPNHTPMSLCQYYYYLW